jgi:murein DD-endopeptidase MepM/ murein hydrolase activator NlpD
MNRTTGRTLPFACTAILVMSLLASGCSGMLATQPPISAADRANLVHTAVAGTVQALTATKSFTPAAPTATPRETATPSPEPTDTLTPIPTLGYTPKPTVDALKIDLPTAGPHPVSAWRPPLYPVPWALTRNDHFYFQRPIAVNEINWPVADYRYGGMIFGPSVVHTGVDIDAPMNTPVLAAADGKVIWAGYGLLSGVEGASDGYGLAVAIKHDFGYNGQRLYTVYAHMSSLTVVDNQEVKAGDQIGNVGQTGNTTGPHLHFEVREGANVFDDTRNPELWIAPPQGWGVLAGRIMDDKGKKLSHIPVHVVSLDSNHEWEVRTYAAFNINPDDNYNENLVLSDLPAGKYKIWIDIDDTPLYYKFVIYPGGVTYLTFWGKDGFMAHPTPTPGVNYLPTATP